MCAVRLSVPLSVKITAASSTFAIGAMRKYGRGGRMNRAVLISIKPEWCSLIATGNKTVEIRKSIPKLDTPFKCYIYCAKTSKG